MSSLKARNSMRRTPLLNEKLKNTLSIKVIMVSLGVGLMVLSAFLFLTYQQYQAEQLDQRVKVSKQAYEWSSNSLAGSSSKRFAAQDSLKRLRLSKRKNKQNRQKLQILEKKVQLYKQMEDYEMRLNLHLDDTDFDAGKLRKQILALDQEVKRLNPTSAIQE